MACSLLNIGTEELESCSYRYYLWVILHDIPAKYFVVLYLNVWKPTQNHYNITKKIFMYSVTLYKHLRKWFFASKQNNITHKCVYCINTNKIHT